MQLRISSPSFADGERIPERHTRDHANLSPPLDWRDAPRETQSFVLVVEDVDAPHGSFYHWAMYDIPSGRTHLDEGAGRRGTETHHGANSWGNPSYDGPLPPVGSGVHRYHFRIAALDVPNLTIAPAERAERVWRAAQDHVLAQAEIVGTYER